MARNEFEKMTPEMRSYYGRLGGLAKKGKTSKRKELKETLEILLNMPMKANKVYSAEDVKCFADLKGKNITIDQAMMVCLVQKALKGDLSAISMIRDTIGEKPAEKVEATVTKNPFDELTADELRELIKQNDK